MSLAGCICWPSRPGRTRGSAAALGCALCFGIEKSPLPGVPYRVRRQDKMRRAAAAPVQAPPSCIAIAMRSMQPLFETVQKMCRGGPISPIGFHRLIQRLGEAAKMRRRATDPAARRARRARKATRQKSSAGTSIAKPIAPSPFWRTRNTDPS